jgi:hypothetical protein
MRARVRALVAGSALALAGCTDAATRIAYALEIGRGPSGDPGKGSLTVRCAGRGIFYTTYHLNFVVVPATLSVRKAAGEPVLLRLEKRAGDIALVEIR